MLSCAWPRLAALLLAGWATPALPGAPAAAPPPRRAETVPLGVNIDGPLDWGREQPFADAMKEARPFGTLASPQDEAAPKDANGWPTGDAAVIVMADTPGIAGKYELSYRGRGQVSASGGVRIQNVAYHRATGTTTADVIVTPGTMDLHLRFQAFPGGVKDVRLIRPGHGPRDLFTKAFLARLRPFTTLRTLGWSQVNGNPEVSWSDRTLPAHATQARRKGPDGQRYGAAWEYFIELCNQTGKDAWINVPDQASDDYVRELAKLVQARLRPDLNVYVEWSNEVWNFAPDFTQSRRNLEAAAAEIRAGDPHKLRYDGNTDRHDAAWRRIAYQAKRLSDLFRSVFGDAAMLTRVRPVLATQTANAWVYQQGLRYLDTVHGAPRTYLWGLAGTSYFYLKHEDRADLTVDRIFADLDHATTRGWMQTLVAWARAFGLRPLCYEGGHHITGSQSAAVKVAANRDPRMKDALLRNYRDWFEVGGDLHNYVALAGRWGPFGQWGLSESIASQDGPKWEAVEALLASPPVAPTVGKLVPGVLRSSDAAVAGDGRDVSSGRSLAGVHPDIAWLLRVPAAGTFRISTDTQADHGAAIRVDVDGLPAATWALERGRASPRSATVRLVAGLHAVRLKVTDGRAAVIGVVRIDRADGEPGDTTATAGQ